MADATKIGVADTTKMGVANARVANATQPLLVPLCFIESECLSRKEHCGLIRSFQKEQIISTLSSTTVHFPITNKIVAKLISHK